MDVLLLLSTFLGIIQNIVCDEHALRSGLFDVSRHNPLVLPRTAPRPIEVTLSWLTGYVVGMDEIEGRFTLMGNLEMSWTDELITWDVNQYNVTSIVVVGKEVWTPPIKVLNKMGSDFLSTGLKNDLLRIEHTGEVKTTHSGELSISCPIDPTDFPFDSQNCIMLFGLSVHSFSEVSLQFSETPVQSVSGGSEITHPIWTISGFTAKNNPYSSIAYVQFCLYRKSLYYSFTMLGPTALLNCLTLFAFLIPNNQGEKISCGMTIFLAFVVLLVQVGDVIPKNSNAVPILGKYYLYSIIGSAIMVINTVIHSCIAHKQTDNDVMKVEPMTSDNEKQDSLEEFDEVPSKGRTKNRSLIKFVKKNGLKIFDLICFLTSVLLIGISVVMLLTTASKCGI